MSFLSNMSAIIFESSLTDTEKSSIRERARSGCKLSDNGHLVLDGIERDEYSKVRVYFRGKSYIVHRARICAFVDAEFEPFPPDLQVSHLCHLKNCCLKAHLTMEPATINNSRKKCFASRQCQGHSEYPQCVFNSSSLD